MMKFITIILIIFSSISTNGQSKMLDSLKNVNSKVNHDSVSCRVMLSIGNQYENQSPDSAIFWYNKVYSKSTKKENKHELFKFYAASAIRSIAWVMCIYKDNNKQAVEFSLKAIKLYNLLDKTSKNIKIIKKSKLGIAACYNIIGIVYGNQSDYNKAIEYYFKALKICEEIDRLAPNIAEGKKGMASCYNNIGSVQYYQGHYDSTIESFLKALKKYEEIEDKEGIAQCYNNIGIVHKEQGSLDKAIEYYQKALKINKELNNNQLISSNYNNIGIIYFDQGKSTSDLKIKKEKYSKAIEYYLQSLKIDEMLGDKNGMTACYNNIGNVYQSQGLYDVSIDYFLKALKINEDLKDKNGSAICYINIASLNVKLSDDSLLNQAKKTKFLNNAINFGQKAFDIAKNIKALPMENGAAKILMESYDKLGNYKLAMKYGNIYIITKDSMFKEEKTKSIAEAEKKFESEKKQLQIEKLNKEKELQRSEILRQNETSRRQKSIIIFIIAGLLLVAVFAIFVVQRLRITRRQKRIIEKQKILVDEKNILLNQQNEEINTQKDEIESQRDLVTNQKNQIENILHEVHQSINYAQRIQIAVLPENSLLENCFSEYFILYKPKDKVSGDFYWWAEVDNQIIITVADCTGHGVPGAFMTMLGTSFLREIVQKEFITDSAVILKKLRKEIIKALKQKGVEGEQKDGMDMALVSINKKSKLMHYAGAHNSLLITRNPDNLKYETENIIEIKADKMPVAIYDLMDNFTNHEIQLHNGDMIYMFSDGYVDQFGGPNRKKFLSKNFRQLIHEIKYKSMTEQEKILNETIENWKGEYEQIDDITVLGLKI